MSVVDDLIHNDRDGTVKIWNSGTYCVDVTLSYTSEHARCAALRKDANEVAVGFDEGILVVKVFTLFIDHFPKFIIPF